MTRKEYEHAATIIQRWAASDVGRNDPSRIADLQNVFAEFFGDDNPRFNAERFFRACVPGANVKARAS